MGKEQDKYDTALIVQVVKRARQLGTSTDTLLSTVIHILEPRASESNVSEKGWAEAHDVARVVLSAMFDGGSIPCPRCCATGPAEAENRCFADASCPVTPLGKQYHPQRRRKRA